ncbi:sensor histidine kinase KdpD [Flavobacterium sp. PL002]|uniref:sensor histidine kinase n=1 Tax=Flavobacterium sp. PL002 TaxID=1897058 RepID=UPI001787BB3A|nr:HAMP domain-containing sensor histidine kinase [Flavobacterium sp. PL002]MBE0390809.1 Sensor histidine kinase ResE [Flavobacterium sp. PL002]
MMFRQKWLNLIGNKEEFSLEKRVFHGVCLITSLVLLISFPANFFLGLIIFGYVLLVVLILLLILFYFSRYRSHSKATFAIYVSFMSMVLVVGYLFNCGIDGPVILIFAITFVILAAIVQKKHLLFWMLFQLFIAYALLYLEYHYPNIIIIHYEERSFRFLDTALTIGILLLTIYLTIRYLKINYRQQQDLSNKKNEELAKANATKDKLFSIISHDLRSPFNALIGLSQMLKENQDELDEAEKEDFVNAIYETSTKTFYLLQNLLEWSLSQTNEIQFSPEKINLNQLVNHALSMPLEVAKSKEIEIEVIIPENQFIVADKNMMETVLRNIVSNAIKFTESQGEIIITSHIDNKGTTLKVADNGIGMTEATLSTLFDQNTTPAPQEIIVDRGMGLGLMLCKDFVERHEGKIWAESNLGKGTTFYIFIKK